VAQDQDFGARDRVFARRGADARISPACRGCRSRRHARRDGTSRRRSKKINPLVPSTSSSIIRSRSIIRQQLRAQADVEDEYKQNQERYRFLKWAQRSFEDFRVVPPAPASATRSILNISPIPSGARRPRFTFPNKSVASELAYPDTLVAPIRHYMVKACSVLGWGVGGIEAEGGNARPALFDAAAGSDRGGGSTASSRKASPRPISSSP